MLLSRGFEALEPYPGAQEWWQCRCRAGHEVQVKLSKVLYGRGCPQCRKSKPLTHEEAVEYMRAAGLEPLEPYPGAHTPWKSRCVAKGHEVQPRLGNVRNGGRCSKCRSARDWSEEEAVEAMIAGGLEPLEPFTSSTAPWKCRCVKAGHEVHTTLTKVRQGYGCRECSPTRKLRQEEAVESMRAAGLEPIGPYVSSNAAWPSHCMAAGHQVAPSLGDVKLGVRCAKCFGNVPMSPDEALRVMQEAGYEPLEPFVSGSRPWPSRCIAKGHVTAPRVLNVLKGTRCLDCAGKRRYSDEQARKAMLEAGFEPLAPYTGTDDPWPSRCIKDGHLVSPRLNSVLRGTRCRDCAPRRINLSLPTVFYVVTDDEVLKGGITNLRNEAQRLTTHRWQGLDKLLGRRLLESGSTAVTLERQWLEYVDLASDYAVEKDRLPDGYTEAVYVHGKALQVVRTLLTIRL